MTSLSHDMSHDIHSDRTKKFYHNTVQPMCNLCVMMDLQKISTGLRIRGPKMD